MYFLHGPFCGLKSGRLRFFITEPHGPMRGDRMDAVLRELALFDVIDGITCKPPWFDPMNRVTTNPVSIRAGRFLHPSPAIDARDAYRLFIRMVYGTGNTPIYRTLPISCCFRKPSETIFAEKMGKFGKGACYSKTTPQ